MAAGGYGRGSGVPLRERRRAGEGTQPSDREEDCPARHCWVLAPLDGSERRAGLLVEWRRDDVDGWQGLVTYLVQFRPGRWSQVTEWLRADVLQAR